MPVQVGQFFGGQLVIDRDISLCRRDCGGCGSLSDRSSATRPCSDLTVADAFENLLDRVEATLGVCPDESLEEVLEALEDRLLRPFDRGLAIKVVAEEFCYSLLLNDRLIVPHGTGALFVGVATLDGLALLDRHIFLVLGVGGERAPLGIGENAHEAKGVDHLMVHDAGDGVEQLLIGHALAVDAHRQADDPLDRIVFALGNAHDLAGLVPRQHSLSALKANVLEAEVVEPLAQGCEHLLLLCREDRRVVHRLLHGSGIEACLSRSLTLLRGLHRGRGVAESGRGCVAQFLQVCCRLLQLLKPCLLGIVQLNFFLLLAEIGSLFLRITDLLVIARDVLPQRLHLLLDGWCRRFGYRHSRLSSIQRHTLYGRDSASLLRALDLGLSRSDASLRCLD